MSREKSTTVVQNGKLKITNVPVKIVHGQETYSGRTAYVMTQIFRHMIDNKLFEFDFNDWRGRGESETT